MFDTLIRISLVGIMYVALAAIGNIINDLFLVTYLTQFFTFLRTAVKPLFFIWDFETSFTLLGYTLAIFSAYLFLQAFNTLKNIMTGND